MSGMFGGGTTNAYDDLVAKTTDENLTTENWELILNVCDKVQDDEEEGPRQLAASLLRRLSHRNPNVQLYTLSLADALSKNVGISVRRELGGRGFTQGLEKLITDRNTHEKVRKRALSLIAEWVAEWTEADDGDGAEAVGVMEDLYNTLKGKNYTFQTPSDPPPPAVDDEIRRKEEEELQRVLEMSVRDRGGWGSNGYGSSGFSGSSNGAGGSGGKGPATSTGFVPTQPGTSAGATSAAVAGSTTTTGSAGYGLTRAGSTTSNTSSKTTGAISNRVRALHPFTPTEPGELGFNAGDVIIVVDRGYKDWWRGQLRGRTGIFPVNYVELLPPPDESQLAAEAIEEAKVFAEVGNVERLLEGLREVEKEWGVYARDQEQNATPPQRLSDNDSLQELYRSCMALRPKIVKLIEKYSQKRADLVSMNETFVRARGIFDRLMEESLASYGVGATGQPPYGAPYGPTPYGPPGGGPYQQGPGPGGYGQPGQAPYGYPGAVPAGAASPPLQGQPPIQGQGQGYPGGPTPAAQGPGVYPQQPYPAVQGYPQQQQQLQAQPVQQQSYPQQQQVQHATPQQQQLQQQPQPQSQPLQQQQSIQQQPVRTSTQPSIQQTQAHPQRQSSSSVSSAQSPPPSTQPAQPQTLHLTGPPPYHYYPPSSGKTVTYADPNVQAWASYYAQGGTDPTGSVYFFSVPGIKTAEPGQPGSSQGSTAETPTGQESGDVSAGAGQSQVQGAAVPGSAVGGASTGNHALTIDEPLSSSGTVSSGHTLENPYSAGYPESAAPNTASFSLYSPSYALPSADPGIGSVIGPGIGLTSMPSLSNPSRSSTIDTLPYPGDLAGSVENLPYPGDAAMINQPSNGSQTAPAGGPGFGLGTGPESPGSSHSAHSFQQQQQQQQAPHQPLQQIQPQSHGQYPYRVALTDSGPAPSPSATSTVSSSTPSLSHNLNTSSSFSASVTSSPPQSHHQNSASFSSLPGVGAGAGPTGGSSPPIASSTPSWVLPKIGAGSGPGAGAAR